LFAQTFTWGASVEGGIGIVNRASDDDPVFAVISPHTGVGAARAELQFAWANANNDAGVRLRMRGNLAGGAANTGDANNTFQIHQAWGWVKPWDVVEFRGGRGLDTELVGFHNIGTWHSLAGTVGHSGVITYIRPSNDITLGLGALAANQVADGKTWEDGGMRLWGGFGVRVPDVVNLRAQLRFGYEDVAALASFSVLALNNMGLTFDAFLDNLNDFSDTGLIGTEAHFSFTGIDAVSLNLQARFDMSQSDAHADPRMTFGAWVSYTALPFVPRIDVSYTSGATYAYGNMVWHAPYSAGFGSNTWSSDSAYLNIRPSIEFRATGNARVLLGATINMEMGDVPAAGGTNDSDMSFGIFAGVRTNF